MNNKIRVNIGFSVLYGCGTWSLTLQKNKGWGRVKEKVAEKDIMA
jgi:hypothetical protein